jgi:hypothetical protein
MWSSKRAYTTGVIDGLPADDVCAPLATCACVCVYRPVCTDKRTLCILPGNLALQRAVRAAPHEQPVVIAARAQLAGIQGHKRLYAPGVTDPHTDVRK